MANVLVVDDDHFMIEIVTRVLTKAGHNAYKAMNGAEALALIDQYTFDLVITDVMMPNMNGWGLIREVRTRPECALLPVIFLTALSSENDRIQGFQLGADDYLAKPFRGEELILRVEKTLRKAGGLRNDTRESLVKPAGFHGTLDQLGLSSLMVILDMEKKSGELILQRKSEMARFMLRAGRIVKGELAGGPAGARLNAECVYYALSWNEGTFSFIRREIDAPDEVKATVNSLLMEGARRLDDGSR